MDDPVSGTQEEINQPLQQSIQQPPQNKSSIFSKWMLLSIAGIALLIIIFGGVYLLSTKSSQPSQQVIKSTPIPTPDETANWKTYISTKLGYSIKYPPNWQNNLGSEDSLNLPLLKQGEYLYSGIFINMADNPKNLTFEEYSKKTFFPTDATDTPKKTIVAGSEAIERTFLHPDEKNPDYPFKTVYIKHNNKIYIIELAQQCSLPEVCISVHIFDQIVSTFKFLDQNQANSASLCSKESEQIKNLVNTFESLQMKNDALGVLSLFTPPISVEDKDTYDFFTGKKEGYIALYGNVTTKVNEPSYQIIGEPVDNPNGCTVNVEEQRRSYSNAGASVGFGPAQLVKYSIDVVKQENIWKIDKYYITGQRAGKYSAWGY